MFLIIDDKIDKVKDASIVKEWDISRDNAQKTKIVADLIAMTEGEMIDMKEEEMIDSNDTITGINNY